MADVVFTAANVLWSGAKDRGVAGATITQGMPLYRDATDGNKLKPADADVQASADVVGFALSAGSNGQEIVYGYGDGDLTLGGGLTAGTEYFLSTNGGGIAPRADLAVGDFLTRLGQAISTSVLRCRVHAPLVALS